MKDEGSIHLKGLNGIRAIAALAVVYQHIMQNSWEVGSNRLKSTDLAMYGVTIFFSLSGFLITYLLLLEKQKSGTISVLSFYKRRILRIWPLYYLYLFVACLVMWLCHTKPLDFNLLYYVFLAANIPFFLGTAFPLIGHYWSLGVEEQFYIFWPWVIKRQKKLVNSLLIILFLFMVLKAIAWMILIKGGVDWPYKLILLNRFDCLVIGALGAVLYMRRAQWFMKLNFNFFIQCLPLIGIVLMAINRFHFIVTIDHDIAAVLTVILIVNVIANEKVILGLNQAPFDFLGKISYGIYIYHPLVIFLAYRILGNYHVGNGGTDTYMILFAMVLCGTILLAWASYVFFEKRFLLMREKYAVIPSKM